MREEESAVTVTGAQLSPMPAGALDLALRTLRISMRLAWFKALGTAAFMTVFFRAYFYLLKHPAGPVAVMPLTALDRWISFQPWALPIYFSLWVYVSLPVALMSSPREIAGYGARVGVLCLLGLAAFYLWPTQVPPMVEDWARYPGFSLLRGIDAAGNACPSLHVASAVFTAQWLDWMAPALGWGTRLKRLNWLWCIAIAYSTLATKQHVFFDVAAGALLGAVVAWASAPRVYRRRAGAGGMP